MRKPFDRRSTQLIVLSLLALGCAWNRAYAIGPSIPPPCDGGACVTSPAGVPFAKRGAQPIGPSIPPPCDGGACVTSPALLFIS